MVKRLRIMPYKLSSTSAKALADGLKEEGIAVLRVKRDGAYVPREEDILINWGANSNPNFDVHSCGKLLNPPDMVAGASHKVQCFRMLDEAGVKTLDYTLDQEIMLGWLGDGAMVFARSLFNGHGGAGITVLKSGDDYLSLGLGEIRNFKFFTKHSPSTAEYRVHVVGGKMIDFAMKRKMGEAKRKDMGIDVVDELVKNHNKGWVFTREGVTIPDQVRDECIKAVAAVKLDFGAVDVLYSEDGGPVILEINTAPGLEGTTLKNYIQAMKEIYDGEA